MMTSLGKITYDHDACFSRYIQISHLLTWWWFCRASAKVGAYSIDFAEVSFIYILPVEGKEECRERGVLAFVTFFTPTLECTFHSQTMFKDEDGNWQGNCKGWRGERCGGRKSKIPNPFNNYCTNESLCQFTFIVANNNLLISLFTLPPSGYLNAVRNLCFLQAQVGGQAKEMVLQVATS